MLKNLKSTYPPKHTTYLLFLNMSLHILIELLIFLSTEISINSILPYLHYPDLLKKELSNTQIKPIKVIYLKRKNRDKTLLNYFAIDLRLKSQ